MAARLLAPELLPPRCARAGKAASSSKLLARACKSQPHTSGTKSLPLADTALLFLRVLSSLQHPCCCCSCRCWQRARSTVDHFDSDILSVWGTAAFRQTAELLPRRTCQKILAAQRITANQPSALSSAVSCYSDLRLLLLFLLLLIGERKRRRRVVSVRLIH